MNEPVRVFTKRFPAVTSRIEAFTRIFTHLCTPCIAFNRINDRPNIVDWSNNEFNRETQSLSGVAKIRLSQNQLFENDAGIVCFSLPQTQRLSFAVNRSNCVERGMFSKVTGVEPAVLLGTVGGCVTKTDRLSPGSSRIGGEAVRTSTEV